MNDINPDIVLKDLKERW